MRIGIVGNPEKVVLKETLSRLVTCLESHELEYIISPRLYGAFPKRSLNNRKRYNRYLSDNSLIKASDIVLALGGDGTILRFARIGASYGVPILGINLGKLGFLTGSTIDEIEKCVDQLVKKQYRIEERSMLEVRFKGKKPLFTALNDIVIDKAGHTRAIDIATYVNEHHLAIFTADGLIISTPTGSTGYSLATGGPIITPETECFIVTPISPHALTARPVIFPDNAVVTVSIKETVSSVNISADGQQTKKMKPPFVVEISRSKFRARLIQREGNSYFDTLRAKLRLGVDPRKERFS